ncbi:hypothetical protein L486_03158 [Kwoniella mangroviensis CBS 10435]|uniref:Helicase C-terminal domain-containing protein n=1 Tax=Kwoniella mangroviensis CBS 10435 TaxID=1331196 RepID=A0A1B9ISZ5_9TREE|nr:hypothetical protein L486_03158 [Kwoniella mangroviensis CBS 10435]
MYNRSDQPIDVTKLTSSIFSVTADDKIVLLRMRDGEVWTDQAKIVVATEGMFYREMLRDPSARRYSAVLFDEIHEQSRWLELMISWSNWVRERHINDDLRFAFMSATTDFAALQARVSLDASTEIRLPTLNFNVSIRYTNEPVPDIYEWVIQVLMEEVLPAKEELDGDVLVFFPGSRECERGAKMIKNNLSMQEKEKMDVYTLYSDLEQNKKEVALANRPIGSIRRIVCATNIAETSVTISNLTYVLDTCYHKSSSFDPELNHKRLLLTPTSEAQANQRAGRTGRTSQGVVFRALTEDTMNEIATSRAFPTAKVKSEDHSDTLLANLALVKAIRGKYKVDFDIFPLPNQPPAPLMLRATDTLRLLGAIVVQPNTPIRLTEDGFKMSTLSLETHFSRSLLQAVEEGCAEEMLELCAACSTQRPILVSKGKLEKTPSSKEEQKKLELPYGDHFTVWNCYRAWIENDKSSEWAEAHGISHTACVEATLSASALSGQLDTMFPDTIRQPSHVPNIEAMCRCLVQGHLHRIAVQLDPSLDPFQFQGATHYNWRDESKTLVVHKSTNVRTEMFPLLIYSGAILDDEADLTSISQIMPVDIEWINAATSKLNQTIDAENMS